MVRFKHYRSGGLYGIRYWFDSVGDAIPEHAHDTTTTHNITVLAGMVDLVRGSTHRLLTAGEVFDFDGAERHRIEAVKAASSILNLYLNGIPPGYDTLPAHELQGTLES
jgi:quercetin dioxygenase-like cupin family protein